MLHSPLSRRPLPFPVKRIEDRHRFSTLAVCHVLIRPIALQTPCPKVDEGPHPVEGRRRGSRRSLERQPDRRGLEHQPRDNSANPPAACGGRVRGGANPQALAGLGKNAHLRWRLGCQIASNSDPLFASNRDPSLAAAWSLSTSCIGGTRARSAAPWALRGAKGAGGPCASRG